MSDSSELITFTGWAATAAGAPLERYSYDPGPLANDEVEVAVEYCGVCHSDQSLIDNDWGISHYPFIPGHEVVGRIVRLGDQVRGLEMGQRVGIGWYKGSCMHCTSCIEPVSHRATDHHRQQRRLCRPHSFALGLGPADPGRTRSGNGRAAVLCRFDRVQPADGIRHQAH